MTTTITTAVAAPSFQKVKWNGTEVKLAWTTKTGGTTEVEHTLKSFDEPASDFAEALRAFVPLVLKLLELPDTYAADFKVVGVSINEEEDGRLGCVVTCLKKLQGAAAPLVLNTPHLRERMDEETPDGFLPGEWLDQLSALQTAAERFLNGARGKQGDLFAGGAS